MQSALPIAMPKKTTRATFMPLVQSRSSSGGASARQLFFQGPPHTLCTANKTPQRRGAVRPIPGGRSGYARAAVWPPIAVVSGRPGGATLWSSRAGIGPDASKWFCSRTHNASSFGLHPKCEQANLLSTATGNRDELLWLLQRVGPFTELGSLDAHASRRTLRMVHRTDLAGRGRYCIPRRKVRAHRMLYPIDRGFGDPSKSPLSVLRWL